MKLQFWKGSLLLQLVSYFSLLSVVTVSIVAIAAYTRARDSLAKSVIDRLTVATSLKEFQLNDWVNTQRQDVLLVSQLPEIRQQIALLLTENPNSFTYKTAYSRLNQLFSDIVAVKPSVQSISVSTNGGFVIFSSNDKSLEGKFRPLGDPVTYFTREGASAVVPNFYTSPATGKAAITFATPVLDTVGVKMGAIAVNLDLGGVDNLIREKTGLGKTGETYLVGRSATKNIFISRNQETDKKYDEGVESFGINSATNRVDGLGLYKNYVGTPVVGVYRWLTTQNLALLAEISQAEAFEPAQRLARDILLIGLSSAGVLLVAVYLLARRITQPILAIADTAIQFTEGNLEITAPILTEDEIGILAKAFNQMTGQMRLSNAQLADYSRTLEQKVEQRTGELTAIIDNLADGLLVIDAAGQISRFNPALLKMFELDRRSLLGINYKERFGDLFQGLIEQTARTAQQVFTTEVALKDGRVGKAVSTAIIQEGDTEEAQQYLGSVVLIRDITAEKEVDQMKTDFISTVSHELRTPLTSVLGFAKLIQKKLDDVIFPLIETDDKKTQRAIRQVGENIGIIVSEGQRLTGLINDVLDVAKMEAGKLDWKMEPLQLSEVVERALTATSALFDAKNLTIVREFETDLPETLGDRDRLIQVVINLISNAVKFTDQGSITCRIQRQDQFVQVSVTDSGIGIAEADLPKVFEKFKQVGDTLTDKPKGTGLGLPICKQIIEHHGGKIWAESVLGEGSTFLFTLPYSEPEPAKFDREQDGLKELESVINFLKEKVATTVSANIEQPSKNILVVDDDPNLRKLLRQQLEAEGHQVAEAEHGIEALNYAKQNLPDLIILDVMMPQMDGYDVAAVLKNDPTTKDIPILMNSGLDDQGRANQVGVDRFITKSMNSEQLLQEVNSLLSQGASKRKVLIVDEDESNLKTLSQALKTKGYSVVAASNNEDFLEKISTSSPDMVIVDAGFSERYGVVKKVRFEKGLENVLFLLLDDQNTLTSTPESEAIATAAIPEEPTLLEAPENSLEATDETALIPDVAPETETPENSVDLPQESENLPTAEGDFQS